MWFVPGSNQNGLLPHYVASRRFNGPQSQTTAATLATKIVDESKRFRARCRSAGRRSTIRSLSITPVPTRPTPGAKPGFCTSVPMVGFAATCTRKCSPPGSALALTRRGLQPR